MRANITIFIDPRQEFDGRLNGFVWVLDYELPSAFVWLIVSLWVMSPCVTGDGQLFIKPRLEPLIGQCFSSRRLIGSGWPLVSRGCVSELLCVLCVHIPLSADKWPAAAFIICQHLTPGDAERTEMCPDLMCNSSSLQFTWLMAWFYPRGVSSANQMPGMGPGHQSEVRSDCMGRTTGEPVQRCTVRIFKIDDQSRFREH